MRAKQIGTILRFIDRHRSAIAVLLVCLIGAMVWQSHTLKIDNALNVWFVDSDPALQSYREFVQLFGSDEVVIIALTDTSLESIDKTIAHSTAVARDLRKVDGVARVLDLSAILPAAKRDSSAAAQPATATDILPTLNTLVEQWPLARQFIGTDNRTLLLYVWIDTLSDIDARRGIILGQIKKTVAAQFVGPVAYAGFGVVFDALNKATIRDGALFTALSWAIVTVVLIIVTGSWVWTLVALLSVSSALLCVFSLMTLLDRPITMVSIALPPLIMVLGVATVIHLSRHSRNAVFVAPQRFFLAALAPIVIPCLFNMLTTAGGYLSLAGAKMAVTRDYGIFAAVGAAAVFCFSLAMTAVFGPILARQKGTRDSKYAVAFSQAAKNLFSWSAQRYRVVLLATSLLALLGIFVATHIVIDTYSIGFLPKNHSVRKQSDAIEKNTGNYLPMEFLLRFPDTTDWKTPTWLNRLDSMHAAIAQLDRIDNPGISAVTFAAQFNGKTPPAKSAEVPAFSLKTLLTLKNLYTTLVSADGHTLRLTVKAPMTSAAELTRLADSVAQTAQAILGPGVLVQKSGYLPLYGKIVNNVLSDQVTSFALAFAVVFALIGALFRSWRFVVAAIPSNLLPVIVVLALMSLFSIRLDIATVTIAATVLGIIVDDTIHLLFAIRRHLRQGTSVNEALSAAASSSGAAVISTSIVLVTGFSVMIFASAASVALTGMLTAVAIAAALLADLVVLPATVVAVFGRGRVIATRSRHLPPVL